MWDLEQRANPREVFIAVLSRLVREVTDNRLTGDDGTYTVLETREEAEQWVRERIGKAVIALDIEGDGNPATVHPSRHEIICLGLCDGTETVILPEELFDGLWPELAVLLELSTTVAHNGKFDAGVLGWVLRGGPLPIRITHDTMLAHYAIWPAGGNDDEHDSSEASRFAYHGLKVLGDLYLGCGNWKLSDTEYANMRSVSLKRMYRYNAFDVQRTHLLLRIFHRQFKEFPKQYRAYRDVLMPASHFLGWVEDSGVNVDVPYVEKTLIPQMTQDVADHTKGLIEQANKILPEESAELAKVFPKTGTWPMVAKDRRMPGEGPKEARRFNPSSPIQVRMILESQGIVLPVNRDSKTGNGSASKKNIELLLREERKGDPFLTSILELRTQEKLLGTYAKPLAEKSHTDHPYTGLRLFPSFHMHKTLTGRLASSGPNIQNQPKSDLVRRAYVPSRPGYVTLQVDYGQAELRVMAVVGKDEYLTRVFSDPSIDIFDDLMPFVFPNVDFVAQPDMKDKLRRQLKACVPLDTKILTRRGWLSHDEVVAGDETPAFDGAGRTVWSKIQEVHHFAPQKVYRYGHKDWGFRVTADHRWLVSDPLGTERMAQTRTIRPVDRTHVAGRLYDPTAQSPFTDEEVRAVAWLQSHGRSSAPMSEKDADTCAGMTGIPAQRLRQIWNQVAEEGSDAFILLLSPHQRDIWLDTFWEFHGRLHGNQKSFIVRTGDIVDTIQLCASLCGYRATRTKHIKDRTCITLTKNTWVGNKQTTQEEISEEPVWCVTTEHGTWTARQGGTIAVTGNCVYGISFSRGVHDLAENLNLPVPQTQAIIDGYLSMVPGVVNWRMSVIDHVRDGVPLYTRLGRTFIHEMITDKNLEDINRRALSFIPQGSASDCCLLAAVGLGEHIRENSLDWEISALIHDAIILEVPQHEVRVAEKTVGDFMVASAKKWFPEVPFAVDGTWGWSWADFSSKNLQKKLALLTDDDLYFTTSEEMYRAQLTEDGKELVYAS